MARGVNKVILVGNVGGDPDVRYMTNGSAVANISLATSESWKDKQTGQQQERTEWHRVVFFGRLAEVVGQYVRKGSKLYVEGKLQTREWEKDGIKRYTTEVLVDITGQMQMLDSRQDGAGGHQSQQSNGSQRPYMSRGEQSPPYGSPAAPPANNVQQAPQQGNPAAPAMNNPVQPKPGYDSFDDDIPFADPYRGFRSLIQ